MAGNPSTLGGGEADKHLIYEGLSRAAADGVLSGAATIRGSDLVFSVWHPELVALRASLGLPRHPMQIVATLHGLDLEHGLMFNVPELRVTVITGARGADAMRDGLAARPWITADRDGRPARSGRRLPAAAPARRPPAVVHRRPHDRRRSSSMPG